MTSIAAWGLALATLVSAALSYVVGTSDVLFPPAMVFVGVVGGLVASRRPRNPIRWLFLGFAFLLMLQGLGDGYAREASSDFAAWLGIWTWMPAFGLLGLSLLLFASGRPLTRRWRWPVLAAAVMTAATVPAALPMLGVPAANAPGPSRYGCDQRLSVVVM